MNSNSFQATFLLGILLNSMALPLNAQTIPSPQLPLPPVPSTNPVPPEPFQLNPLLNPNLASPEFPQIPTIQGTTRVKKFVFFGNTVFTRKRLETVVAPFVDTDITFSKLKEAINKITALYVNAGYKNSGAYIPAVLNWSTKPPRGVVINVAIVEGTATINVIGSPRLRRYVRQRLQAAVSPVNKKSLERELRLLQADPLLKKISAELMPGSELGEAALNVRIEANPTFTILPDINNNRSPLVGTVERRIELNNANLLGLGDQLSFTYRNTQGSNAGEASYILPFDASNGTVQLDYTNVHSKIIEPPFNQLNIATNYRSYGITVRQPLLRTASNTSIKEFALGLTAAREEGDESLLGMPFPISPGDDSRGRTRISALRFFQEWNSRSNQEVFSTRSELSFGTGALNATIHTKPPDGRFFLWRGETLWYRYLNPHKLALLTRIEMQFASKPLVPFEQFSLGGISSVRGYRQDAVLTDNGGLISLELRFPLVNDGVNSLQIGPFFNGGFGYNTQGPDPHPSELAGAGIGLEYQLADRLHARLDYAIPIVAFPNTKRTLQENGLYLELYYIIRF